MSEVVKFRKKRLIELLPAGLQPKVKRIERIGVREIIITFKEGLTVGEREALVCIFDDLGYIEIIE